MRHLKQLRSAGMVQQCEHFLGMIFREAGCGPQEFLEHILFDYYVVSLKEP